jgi:uncharacterized phage protein (TIGR02220 family)
MDRQKNAIRYLIGQGNMLSTNKLFIRFCGSHARALLFGQIWYHSTTKSVVERGGWFYKTYDEWEEETCAGRKIVSKAVKDFKDWGFLSTHKKKVAGVPKIHYVFDEEKALECLEDYAAYYKLCLSSSKIPSNYAIFLEKHKGENGCVPNRQVDVYQTDRSMCTESPVPSVPNGQFLYTKSTNKEYLTKNTNKEPILVKSTDFDPADSINFLKVEEGESEVEQPNQSKKAEQGNFPTAHGNFPHEQGKRPQKKEKALIDAKNALADEVIQFFNKTCGKKAHFGKQSGGETNRSTVKKILNKGYDIETIRGVIAMKHWEWEGDMKMEQYIRLKTLFASENFVTYADEYELITSFPSEKKKYVQRIKAKKQKQKGKQATANGKIITNDKYAAL